MSRTDDVVIAYAVLRDQCLVDRPGDAGYINDLHDVWALRLRELTFHERQDQQIAFYLHVIKDDADENTRIEWLDAFPSAILDIAGERQAR